MESKTLNFPGHRKWKMYFKSHRKAPLLIKIALPLGNLIRGQAGDP